MAHPRIIGGKARGLRLKPVPGDSTRPITDRVKESLFNIIGSDIQGSSFLDLFGGTGSVSIEALSRGASFARIIDINHLAIKTLKTNLEFTHLSGSAEVIQANALSYLKHEPDRQFDYVYVAPPQYKGIWQNAVNLIDEYYQWLSCDAWMIAQIHPLEYKQLDLNHLGEFEQRKYGSTLLVFYEHKQN